MCCRGVIDTKFDLLWDLIWNDKNCQNRRKALKWDNKNLKKFFQVLFYFSEVFPKRFYKEYEKDMGTLNWRMQKGIKSLGKDSSWEDKKVNELDEKFNEKIQIYFETQILEKLFGQASTLKLDEIKILFKEKKGMFGMFG